MTSQNYQIVVLGAGASGLMCAATAAARGRSVIVLDHANKAAKKVLMSGGGRCNFTNMYTEPDNYISNNPHFCKSALSRFTPWDFIAMAEKHGVEHYEKSLGQLFCKQSSRDIRDLLLKECQDSGARVQLKCQINTVEKLAEKGFKLQTSIGEICCDSLVVATGGLSIPTMGATGFGYQLAEQFGHSVIATRAGLTPLTFSSKKLKAFQVLAGNSLEVEASCNGKSFKEALLFTHKGLSGPAILQISNYWCKGDAIRINLLPQLDIADWLNKAIKKRPEIQLKTLLSSQFSNAFATYLVEQLGNNAKLKQLEHKDCDSIVNLLQEWTLYPQEVEGYRVAEVTLGGINTDEVSSKSFESKKQPGLYFIGEVLDVTGQLGGFNFQWAWASGVAAGECV